MEKYVVQYAGESTRTRIWQDAALAAMQSLIATNPPSRDEIEKSPAGIEQYARDIARAAYTIADEMHKQHGPSESTYLQDESPFVIDPSAADPEESAD